VHKVQLEPKVLTAPKVQLDRTAKTELTAHKALPVPKVLQARTARMVSTVLKASKV
jgi:hypothetical protein